jgi:hypothetical protein
MQVTINKWQRVVVSLGAAALLFKAYTGRMEQEWWTITFFLGILLLVAAFLPAPLNGVLWPSHDIKRGIAFTIHLVLMRWKLIVASVFSFFNLVSTPG